MIPLVLLPGMMCDARLFGPQIAAFSGTRAVQCAPIPQPSVADSAALVLKDAPPVFALSGLSMGGIVAMEVLRQAPERVAGLALLDTNPLAETDEVRRRRDPQIAKVKAGQLSDVMRDEMKPHYLTDGPDRPAILELCMDMANALGPDVFIHQSKALQDRPDQTETLKACQVPSLILCGEHDALCPVHQHRLMHDLIPHATLDVIEKAGHLPTLEQPELTNAALGRWLEAL